MLLVMLVFSRGAWNLLQQEEDEVLINSGVHKAGEWGAPPWRVSPWRVFPGAAGLGVEGPEKLP